MPVDVDYKIFDKKSDCDLEIYLRPCHCVIYVSICTYTYILYIYITINIYYHMINIWHMIKGNDLILHLSKILWILISVRMFEKFWFEQPTVFSSWKMPKRHAWKLKSFPIVLIHWCTLYFIILGRLIFLFYPSVFLRPPWPHGVIKKLLVLVQSHFYKYLD